MNFKKKPLPQRGVKIKMGLIKKNMTQRELAEKLSINENHLADIIRGRRPGNKHIDRIYKELEIEPDEDNLMRGAV